MKRKSFVLVSILLLCLISIFALSGCKKNSNEIGGIKFTCDEFKATYSQIADQTSLSIKITATNVNENNTIESFSYKIAFYDGDSNELSTKTIYCEQRILVGEDYSFEVVFSSSGDYEPVKGEIKGIKILPSKIELSLNGVSSSINKQNKFVSFLLKSGDEIAGLNMFFQLIIILLVQVVPAVLYTMGAYSIYDKYDGPAGMMISGAVLYFIISGFFILSVNTVVCIFALLICPAIVLVYNYNEGLDRSAKPLLINGILIAMLGAYLGGVYIANGLLWGKVIALIVVDVGVIGIIVALRKIWGK